MAAGTVGYTDTRGNKDYTSIIASQIGKRLKEASDMAADERAFASKKAEEGGTSLEEAGIGKGHFFKRALGSRFGGDKIARTKGRMGMGGAGTNPASNYKQRFRGGFDYNVTNEAITDVAPLSNALVVGLRGVEQGLGDVSQAIQRQGTILDQLSRSQADMAKATMFNGYLFAMFQSQQKQKAGRESLRREERSLEGRRRSSGRSGSNRNMINVTPKGRGGGFGGGVAGLDGLKSAFAGTLNVAQTAQLANRIAPATGKVAKSLATTGKITTEKGLQTASKLITGDVLDEKALKAIDDIIPGVGAVSKIFSGDSMRGAALAASSDELIAHGLGKASKSMSPQAEKLLNELMYGDLGKTAIKQGDAAELFAVLSKEGFNGPMSTDEVLDLMKQGMGPKEYEKLMNGVFKGADKPIAKQLTGTVAEQVTKQASKQAAKATAKTTAKSIGKSIWKKVPLIGALAGIGFGIQRAVQGDLLGAGLEITSGMLGMVPGLGSGIGLGIDGFLLARDLGMMPMAKGGIVKGVRGKGLPMMLGGLGGTRALVGEGGSDEAVLPLNKKTFLSFGLGFIDAIKAKQSDFVKNLGMGVFSGIGDAARGGLFEGIGTGIQNLVDNFKDISGNIKDRFINFKNSLTNTLSNIKDRTGNLLQKINPFKKDEQGNNMIQRVGSNVKNWWNKDSSDGSVVDNARFNVQKFINRRILGKNDTKYMQGYNPTPGVTYGSLPSDYKEQEAKLFQSAMYQPTVSNDSGVNLIPGSIVGNTYITNNYNGGGGQGGGSDDGNADISDLGSGFNEMVGAFALGTK